MQRDPIPAPLLERHAHGELEGTASRTRVESAPDLQAQLDALRGSDAELLARFPPERMVPRIQARLREESSPRAPERRAPWFALAGGLAVAAAAVLLFVRLPLGTGLEADGLRTKGGDPRLFIHRQSGPRTELLGDLTDAHGGDVLQLSYAAAGRRYGVILSIDGSGAVTLHYPESESAQTTLRAEGEVQLPFAYRLDDAPAFERFVFVTSDSPLSASAVLDAARRTAALHDPSAPLALPPAVEQHALTLRKRDP